jgi:hypothetical protein
MDRCRWLNGPVSDPGQDLLKAQRHPEGLASLDDLLAFLEAI